MSHFRATEESGAEDCERAKSLSHRAPDRQAVLEAIGLLVVFPQVLPFLLPHPFSLRLLKACDLQGLQQIAARRSFHARCFFALSTRPARSRVGTSTSMNSGRRIRSMLSMIVLAYVVLGQ